MRDIDELLTEVLLYAPDCADIVAYRFLREAAAELCQRTKQWRYTGSMAVTTPESQAIIAVEDARIFTIETAFLDGTELTPVTPAWLDKELPGWENSYADTAPGRYVTQIAPDTVTVIPKVTGTLDIRLVLYPSRDAMTLPDFVVDHYASQVGKAAAGRVLLLPNSANPTLGAAFVNEWKSTLDELSVKATKGQQNAPLRSKGAYF